MQTSYLTFFGILLSINTILCIVADFVLTKKMRARGLNFWFISIFIVFHVVSYFHLKTDLQETKLSFAERLSGYAPAYGSAMKQLGVDKLNLGTASSDPTYLKIIDTQKQWLLENSFVADIYTLIKTDKGEFAFLVDSETDYDKNGKFEGARESRTVIGEIFHEDLQVIDEAFKGGMNFNLEPVTDRWGTWISAYYPIRSDDGSIRVVAGIDFSAQKYSQDIYHSLRRNFTFLFIFFLVIYSFFVAFRIQEKSYSDRLIFERDLQFSQSRTISNAKLAALGEMAAGIAHEINNPLMVIVGKTSILKRQILNGEIDQKIIIESLNKIERTTFRISTIINGLKTFSRDAGKDEFKDVKLSKIMDETLVLCQEKFWHKEINLEIKPVPNVTINCRQAQIIQVLINILNNSVDAVKELPERWVQVSFEMRTIDTISIFVTDSGKGIPSEIADKMMQPFFTTKDQGKGTGIALSISKGIVEEHQGQLYLDRECSNTRIVVVLKAKIV